MSLLSKQGLFGGEITKKIKFYESCVIGKQYRMKFDTGKHTRNEILEDVHVYMSVPSLVNFHSGCSYFVLQFEIGCYINYASCFATDIGFCMDKYLITMS